MKNKKLKQSCSDSICNYFGLVDVYFNNNTGYFHAEWIDAGYCSNKLKFGVVSMTANQLKGVMK